MNKLPKPKLAPETIPPVTEDGFYTVAEVATLLRVSKPKVYHLLDKGELSYCRFGSCRRVPKRAVAAYLNESLVLASK